MIEMVISPRSDVTSVGIQGVQTVAQLLPPWIRIEMGISPNQMSNTVSVGKRVYREYRVRRIREGMIAIRCHPQCG